MADILSSFPPGTRFRDRLREVLEPWLDVLLVLAFCIFSLNDSDGRDAGRGILIIWLTLRLVWRPRQGALQLVMLGLLLVNVRVIALAEHTSPVSPTDFLLVALGFAAGLGREVRHWWTSLLWIGAIPLSVVSLHPQRLLDAFPMGKLLVLDTIGNKNLLATVFCLSTLAALYAGLHFRHPLVRCGVLLLALGGAMLSLRLGSRVAQLLPLLTVGLAYALTRWRGRISLRKLVLILVALTTFLALTFSLVWFFGPGSTAGSPDDLIDSDLGRLVAARCWGLIPFSGHNRFIYGIGFGSRAKDYCAEATYQYGGEWVLGHAHNTAAEIFGDTGSAGLMALVVLVTALVLRHWSNLAALPLRLPLGVPGVSFAEASLALSLFLGMNALITTIYHERAPIQVLIGYALSSAFFSPNRSVLAPRSPAPEALKPGTDDVPQ